MADNRAYVYQRLRRELGLTPVQAAGAIGGLGGESGRTLDPNAVNPSSGALGIGQWLGGRARGVRKGDLRSQTSHLIAELKGPERAALSRLRSAHDIGSATRAWVEAFERPSASEIASSMPARLQYSRDAFKTFGSGGGGGSAPAPNGPASARAASAGTPSQTITETTPGVDNSAARRSLVLDFLGNKNSDVLDFAMQAKQLADVPATSTTRTIPGTPGTVGGGSPDAPSSNTGPHPKFGKSHSPLLELIHNTGNGPGYAVKHGQKVDGRTFYASVWDGHRTHVHVAAGPKTVVQLGRLAQQMGLHVGENPHFGGVDPVHVPGSYHYKGEAIDVSGDPQKMNAYARRVERLYGIH